MAGRARVLDDRIRRPRWLACAIALGLAGMIGAGAAQAGRRDLVGSAVCGGCHVAELRAWQRTAHATATTRLGPRPEGRCLACHGTGDAPAGETGLLEVGCEACHGAGGVAGAGYAADDVMRDSPLARALGLRDVSTPAARSLVCAGCHRGSLRLRPFDPSAPVHPVSPSSPAPPAKHP
jgi:hypothetical protein